MWADVRPQAIERVLQLAGGGGLHQVGEGAVREPVLALLLDRQHLHGDVAGGGIELEVVQHRPPQHVGEEHVEGDGRGAVLASQRQRLHARARPPGL